MFEQKRTLFFAGVRGTPADRGSPRPRPVPPPRRGRRANWRGDPRGRRMQVPVGLLRERRGLAPEGGSTRGDEVCSLQVQGEVYNLFESI